jgi:hypothetical protein
MFYSIRLENEGWKKIKYYAAEEIREGESEDQF